VNVSLSLTTKASTPPPATAWKLPTVVGKFAETVFPAR
jgi:hypothetical protein